jgi:3-oxoacyl-[acyl-carrier-protein] synthase-1/3-oxoacyl-[acyl-carrier-protein] synthase II
VGGDLGGYDLAGGLDRVTGDFEPDERRSVRRLFRATTFSGRMTILCALEAFAHAGLRERRPDPFRVSVPVGGHNFNSRYVTENNRRYAVDPDFIDPLMGVHGLDPNIAACVAEVLGAHGPTLTLGGACASGNLALREGFRSLLLDEADVAVVCGAPFDMTELDLHASVILNAVVVDPELQSPPEAASRPFDRRRAGFVPSHGAAALILETLDHARARDARIHAELLGVRANGNASHLPAPASRIQAALMADLLRGAGVAPDEVDYVNCHATSTPVGDLEEVSALRRVFGDARPVLNAPKSMLGHTCWAAPLVETIGGILQMQRGVLHPSINVEELDEAVPFDVCADGPRERPVEVMLKNSFGFGGINCCSLYRRWAGGSA